MKKDFEGLRKIIVGVENGIVDQDLEIDVNAYAFAVAIAAYTGDVFDVINVPITFDPFAYAFGTACIALTNAQKAVLYANTATNNARPAGVDVNIFTNILCLKAPAYFDTANTSTKKVFNTYKVTEAAYTTLLETYTATIDICFATYVYYHAAVAFTDKVFNVYKANEAVYTAAYEMFIKNKLEIENNLNIKSL